MQKFGVGDHGTGNYSAATVADGDAAGFVGVRASAGYVRSRAAKAAGTALLNAAARSNSLWGGRASGRIRTSSAAVPRFVIQVTGQAAGSLTLAAACSASLLWAGVSAGELAVEATLNAYAGPYWGSDLVDTPDWLANPSADGGWVPVAKTAGNWDDTLNDVDDWSSVDNNAGAWN